MLIVSVLYVYEAKFFSQSYSSASREPEAQNTQMAWHHRPQTHQLKAPTLKPQPKTPTQDPKTPQTTIKEQKGVKKYKEEP